MDVLAAFAFSIVMAAIVSLPVFVVVLAITTLGRKALPPWARQGLWSLVLLRLLLPVSIGTPYSLLAIPGSLLGAGERWAWPASVPDEGPDTIELETPEGRAEASRALLANTLPRPAEAAPPAVDADEIDWTWDVLLPSVLWAGMLAMGLWTLATTLRLRRWVRSGQDCTDEAWLRLLAEGQRLFGMDQEIALRTLPGLAGPATCGWWRPKILLPEDASSWTDPQRRHVLWHELAHIRRRDVVANWGLAVVRVLHWWNPIFWWTERAWLAERELACDALVLRRLDGQEIPAYGLTLLAFAQRLAAPGAAPSPAAPGFVLLLGRKRALRRRLRELSRLPRLEGTARQAVAGAMIVTVALVGLTDAAAPLPPERPKPLELPSGTTWNMVEPERPGPHEPRVDREHSLSATIERLRLDDPATPNLLLASDLQQTFTGILGFPLPEEEAEETAEEKANRSWCRVERETLQVHATAEEQATIERLLARWARDGRRQVSVLCTMVTTTGSFKELLPGTGGTIRNLSPAIALGNTGLDQSGSLTQHTVPSFVRTLDPAETAALIQGMQSSPETTAQFGPKVTVFDGMSARIQSGAMRPFVTGLQTKANGDRDPHISTIVTGWWLSARPEVEENAQIRVAMQFGLSDVDDVEVLETSVDGKSVAVQIPHVSNLTVAVDESIPDGHTLLIVPLRRDRNKALRLWLIRPLRLP